MNFKFAANSIRVRISTDEFSQLRSGKTLSLEVPLTGHHVFRAKLNLSIDQWHFDSDPTGMWVSVPRAEVEALGEALPSKDGIEHQFVTNKDDLTVSLEVDVRKRNKSSGD